jgi:hypothetical protein
MGRGSSVGLATRYGLDDLGIEFRWVRDFPHPPRPALCPSSLLYNGCRVFPGGKAAGAWLWPPTPSNANVKEGVELYLYSPSGPSWSDIGWTLPYLSREYLITTDFFTNITVYHVNILAHTKARRQLSTWTQTGLASGLLAFHTYKSDVFPI